MEAEINSIEYSQEPGNPFKGLAQRITNTSSSKFKTKRDTSVSTNTQDTTDLKRKRSDRSSNSSIAQDTPINPAMRDNKHVSFILQENNNNIAEGTQTGADIPVPEKLNIEVGEKDPAREYKVISEAEKMWRLALDEYRTAARDHSRLTRVAQAINDNKPDLWVYGIAPAPDYMQNLMKELIPMF